MLLVAAPAWNFVFAAGAARSGELTRQATTVRMHSLMIGSPGVDYFAVQVSATRVASCFQRSAGAANGIVATR